MATILQTANAHMARILPFFDRKDDTYFAGFLVKVGAEKGAATQCAFAIALLNIRDERAGYARCDLAHEIAMKQLERCIEFGERAYPLSEKQCRVVAEAAGKERH